MNLQDYQKKRKFEVSPEPKGKVLERGGNRFVVHEHQARRLHYDFRLEMEGVLKSWAVPKTPPLSEGIKRLAIEVEDHPADYLTFTGTIPEGQYGAGKVKIWDIGTYENLKKSPESYEFVLAGKKLKGPYVLLKTKGYGRAKKPTWLFFKKKS